MSQAQVVVGVDGSVSSERALLWAADEAERRHASLVLAYAGREISTDPADGGVPLDSAAGLLEDATAMVLDRAFAGDIRTVVRDEPAVVLLTQLGTHAVLVVVGAHGLGRTGGTLLGSVAYRVASQSACPVAVVSEPPDRTTVRDLPVGVGVSMSAGARPALEFAFAEASLRGVPLNAIHSWAELDWSGSGSRALYTTAAEFALRKQQSLRKMLAPVRARYPDVQLTITLSGDSVGAALATASSRCSVLIVGCRRDGTKLLSRLGPTSSRLVHVAECPLVIVGKTSVTPSAANLARLSHAR